MTSDDETLIFSVSYSKTLNLQENLESFHIFCWYPSYSLTNTYTYF